MRSSVVLPAPFGPTSATLAPSPTRNDTSAKSSRPSGSVYPTPATSMYPTREYCLIRPGFGASDFQHAEAGRAGVPVGRPALLDQASAAASRRPGAWPTTSQATPSGASAAASAAAAHAVGLADLDRRVRPDLSEGHLGGHLVGRGHVTRSATPTVRVRGGQLPGPRVDVDRPDLRLRRHGGQHHGDRPVAAAQVEKGARSVCGPGSSALRSSTVVPGSSRSAEKTPPAADRE